MSLISIQLQYTTTNYIELTQCNTKYTQRAI